jgi:imidazole glycerol-phosphate synthase subunit HisH
MKKPYRIAVIDYGMSNMFSIENALNMLGLECVVTSDYERIISADGAILPGVGAFPEAMKRIEQFGLGGAIRKFISSGKPFMGICLGFQLLFEESEEMGGADGLGIIKGRVKNFPFDINDMRVPHVGWNSVKKNKLFSKKNAEGPLKNIDSGAYFYFVHSYYVHPANEMDISTTTEYGGFEFCSSVWKDNIFGCQFHPEKSGDKGIRILDEIFNV